METKENTEKEISNEERAPSETSQGQGIMARLTALEKQADEAAVSGDYRSALNNYNTLLSKYPLEMRGRVLGKIESLLPKIAILDIELIIQSPINRIPQSMLLYHLGLQHAARGEMVRAKEILTRFITAYPGHKDTETAKKMVMAMEETSFHGDRIGCLLPLSGKYAVFGEKALRGVQMAVRDLTPRYQDTIRLIVKDTASDSERAVQCVRELAQESVAAIAGPMVTAAAAAVEAQLHGIPMICMTQKSEVADVGESIFANFLTPELQVDALLNYALNRLGVERFGIIYPEDRYGMRYMTIFSEMTDLLGGDIVSRSSYADDKKDFGDVVGEMAAAFGGTLSKSKASSNIKMDKAVFIPGSPRELSMILPQFAYHNLNDIYLLGTNLWHHPDLLNHAAGYVNHAVITDGFYAESVKRETARFTEDFRRIYGGESPGFIEAIAYDTVAILIKTAMEPSIDSRMALTKALAGNRIFEGVTGKTRFDTSGKTHKELFFLTVDENNRFVEIGANHENGVDEKDAISEGPIP